MKCRASSNENIPCEGNYVKSEGLCLRHACAFDIWICEFDGNRVYGFKDSTIGEENPEKLRRWKRFQFHKWLKSITLSWLEERLES